MKEILIFIFGMVVGIFIPIAIACAIVAGDEDERNGWK